MLQRENIQYALGKAPRRNKTCSRSKGPTTLLHHSCAERQGRERVNAHALRPASNKRHHHDTSLLHQFPRGGPLNKGPGKGTKLQRLPFIPRHHRQHPTLLPSFCRPNQNEERQGVFPQRGRLWPPPRCETTPTTRTHRTHNGTRRQLTKQDARATQPTTHQRRSTQEGLRQLRSKGGQPVLWNREVTKEGRTFHESRPRQGANTDLRQRAVRRRQRQDGIYRSSECTRTAKLRSMTWRQVPAPSLSIRAELFPYPAELRRIFFLPGDSVLPGLLRITSGSGVICVFQNLVLPFS